MEERFYDLVWRLLGEDKKFNIPPAEFQTIKSFLRTEITRANNELAEKIAGKVEPDVNRPPKSDFERGYRLGLEDAAAIARSFIRNEEEI